MKVWIGFLALFQAFVAASVYGATAESVFYRFGTDQGQRFQLDSDFQAWVSAVCFADPGVKPASKCKILSQMQDLQSGKYQKDLGKLRSVGGQNPGSLICTELLGNSVMSGRDSKGNEQTFCRSEDGSSISSGSLDSILRRSIKKSKSH